MTTEGEPTISKRTKAILIVVSVLLSVTGMTGYLLLKDSKPEAKGPEVNAVETKEPEVKAVEPLTVNQGVPANQLRTIPTGSLNPLIASPSILSGTGSENVNPVITNNEDENISKPALPATEPEIVASETESDSEFEADLEIESDSEPENPSSEPVSVVAVVFTPIKPVVVSEMAKAYADDFLLGNDKLSLQVASGNFLGARKRFADKAMTRKYCRDERFMELREEVGEEIYRRAFANRVEGLDRAGKVKLFADEVMRRDEELSTLVADGEFKVIKAKFHTKKLRLKSVIKSRFYSYTDEISEELYQRALRNKPNSEDEDVDFTALADEALDKDENLKDLVRKGNFDEAKTRFLTKTLKHYGLNDDMYEYKAGVLDVLTRKAEDNYYNVTMMRTHRRDESAVYVDRAMELDEELKGLVESGGSQYIVSHFFNQTVKQEDMDPKVIEQKDGILIELLRRANLTRIRSRQQSESEADRNASLKDLLLPENTPKKKRRNVLINLERNDIREFED